MTLVPAKAGGWNEEDTLTSDEMNALQVELLKAIDGQDGGTYDLLSALTFTGAAVNFEGDVTIASLLTVLAGGSLVVAEDGEATIADGANLTFASGSTLTADAGSDLNISGQLDIRPGGQLVVRGGANMALNTGSVLTVEDDATINLAGDLILSGDGNIIVGDDALIIMQGGSILQLQEGSTLSVQALANMTVAATGAITLDRARDVRVADESFTVNVLLTPVGVGYDSGNPIWSYGNDNTLNRFAWIQRIATLGAQNFVTFGLPLRPGDVVTGFIVRVEGGFGGAHGDVPENQPIARLVEIDSDGNVTPIHSKADAQGSLAGYDGVHNITSDVLAHPVAGSVNGRVYMQVLGESGTDAAANKLAILRITVSGTRKTLTGDANTEYR